MKKDKLDYRLVNILLILLSILIIYETRTLWILIIKTIFEILKPLLISIIISYICNLYLKKLNKHFNKYISILIFIITITTIIYLIFFKLPGLIIEQIKDSFNIFIYFFKTIIIKYNLDIFDVYNKIGTITKIPSTIGKIFNYMTLIIVVISSSIYIFFDYKKIKNKLKKIIPKKLCDYITTINKDIENYTFSFLIIAILNIIEYTIIFKIVGHPNYLFLGVLAGIMSLVPIFGGLITNIVAIMTSFAINYGLFIRTLIGILILTILDGYIVGPIIYSKNNKIPPLMVILSIYTCSKLLGLFGVIIAVPILIIIISSYKYIKKCK